MRRRVEILCEREDRWQWPLEASLTLAQTPVIFFEASKDLRLDDSIFGVPVEMGQRQTIKDAATTVLLPQNAPVLSEIVGAEGMFNDDRIKAWKTNYANRANQPDGRIDAFSQGGIGDCFLLSAVNDMAKTPEGRRQIQNSISNNQNNGSYSIQLAGDPNKTVFTVTQAEVDAARAKGTVSNDNVDTIAFELGIEKYDQLHGATIVNGGLAAGIMKLVTGRTDAIQTGSAESSMASLADAAGDSDGFAVTLSCGVTGERKPVAFDDPASRGAHAFAVTSIDKATGLATVENPWNTSKPYQIPLADLAGFGHLDYLPSPGGATAAATAKKDARDGAKAAPHASSAKTSWPCFQALPCSGRQRCRASVRAHWQRQVTMQIYIGRSSQCR